MYTTSILLGSTYNIPVLIWITETFPFVPPLAYVKPTSSMAIKVSKHVDANGRVFLPYLHEWNHVSSDVFLQTVGHDISTNHTVTVNS